MDVPQVYYSIAHYHSYKSFDYNKLNRTVFGYSSITKMKYLRRITYLALSAISLFLFQLQKQ